MLASVSHLRLVLLLSLLTSPAVEGARVVSRSSSVSVESASSAQRANLTDADEVKAMEACAAVFAIEERRGTTKCRAPKMTTEEVFKKLKILGDDSLTLPTGFTCGRGYECENSEGVVLNVLAGASPSVCGGQLQGWKTCVAIDERSYLQSLSSNLKDAWVGASDRLSSEPEPATPEEVAELAELTEGFNEAWKLEESQQPVAPQPAPSNNEKKKGTTPAAMDPAALCNLVFEHAQSKCRTPQMLRKDVEKAIKPKQLPEGWTCQRGYECEGSSLQAGNTPAVCRGQQARRVCIPLKLGKNTFLKKIMGR